MADHLSYEPTALEKTLALRAEAFRQANARNKALFEHSPLNILVLAVGELGVVTVEECNPAFCRNAGLQAEQVTGQAVELALGETGAVLALGCRTALAEGRFDCDHALSFPVGERVVRSYYQPLPDAPGGGPRRVLLSQIDLTESRRGGDGAAAGDASGGDRAADRRRRTRIQPIC